MAQWDEVEERRREIDGQLAELARQRQALDRERTRLRDRIWPRWVRGRGRRLHDVAAGEQPLPALPPDPELTWGRALRAHALRILREVQTALSLTELHRLLHLRGLAVDAEHPAKALADALGYETEQGRVERVARGCYRICRAA